MLPERLPAIHHAVHIAQNKTCEIKSPKMNWYIVEQPKKNHRTVMFDILMTSQSELFDFITGRNYCNEKQLLRIFGKPKLKMLRRRKLKAPIAS